ncbi:MAG: helix-turn-helix transcriptional regulator [Hyphomicrobiales bacterium]
MNPVDQNSTHGRQPISAATRCKSPGFTANPAGEVGWFLKRERKRYGCSLKAAAQAVGIHPRYLTAIENGKIARLPENNEVVRYVCIYARYLGFEPEPLARHYLSILGCAQKGEGYGRASRLPHGSAKIGLFSETHSGWEGFLSWGIVVLAVFIGALNAITQPTTGGATPPWRQTQDGFVPQGSDSLTSADRALDNGLDPSHPAQLSHRDEFVASILRTVPVSDRPESPILANLEIPAERPHLTGAGE